jgi:hypothetical protein
MAFTNVATFTPSPKYRVGDLEVVGAESLRHQLDLEVLENAIHEAVVFALLAPSVTFVDVDAFDQIFEEIRASDVEIDRRQNLFVRDRKTDALEEHPDGLGIFDADERRRLVLRRDEERDARPEDGDGEEHEQNRPEASLRRRQGGQSFRCPCRVWPFPWDYGA